MKKLFGGKKKKKSKPASFNSADSDFQVKDVVPRRLIMSHSTDQPRLSVTNSTNNNSTNNNSTISNTISNSNNGGKGLVHSKSQGIMKTKIPTQPAMTKRLNRPTSSPPALVMPRPRYAEPPTRAVLKSFEHEKTLLDLDPAHGQQELRKPLLSGQGGFSDDINRTTNIQWSNGDSNPTINLPRPSASVSTPNKFQKLTLITDPDHSPRYDTKPIIRNKKSLDSGIATVINAKKHESLNSVTGSDDSNRVYESALESPMMASTSTTTTNLNHHHHHSFATTESIFTQSQLQRHSSPSVFNGILVPQLVPPTASDSSETVTPAGSTSQQLRAIASEQSNIISAINNMDLIRPTPQLSNPDQAPTPATTGSYQQPLPPSPKKTHQSPNRALQSLHPSQDLESLQQQVLLIQQQREMDRVEYERMEQVHKERTKWMKAEIDRTQSKLLELTASKRTCMSSQQQCGDDLPPAGREGKGNEYFDDDDDDDDAGNQKASVFQREQRQQQQHQHEQQLPSSPNTTPSRSQKSTTKLYTNPTRMSRSSSKTSNGGRSSSGGPTYRSKGEGQQQSDMHPREMMNEQDGEFSSTNVMVSDDQPAYTNGTQSGNLSRQSSGRKSQQSQQSRHHRSQPQQMQDQQQIQMAPTTPRSRPREQRPRSKSTESRMPSQPLTNPNDDYYSDPYDEVLYGRPPSRPQSNNSRRRYHQRSASVERPHPYYYDMTYFYPPGAYGDEMDGVEMDDGMDMDDNDEHDMDHYRYMDMEYRYPHLHQQQQRYDSFPPHHRQRIRQYYSQAPYMSGPMNFMPPPPPPQIQPSMSTGPPTMQSYNNRQRMTPSRMDMEIQQQEHYGVDGPASYYSSAPPPSRRRQSQPQQLPPHVIAPTDDGYWGGGGPPSFNRYPPLPPAIRPYMRMDDPQRRSYWRSRPPPPSEYAM